MAFPHPTQGLKVRGKPSLILASRFVVSWSGLEAGEMSAMLDLPDVPVVSSMPVARLGQGSSGLPLSEDTDMH